METTLDLIRAHPFLADLPTGWQELLSYRAKRAVYHQGHRLFHEGGRADRFWLIRHGRVSLDIHIEGRGEVLLESLGAGEVVGWSWMFPPNRWQFGAIASEHTLALQFDGPGVLQLCADDPALGYELTRRFMGVVINRLQSTRIRLLDLYGYPTPAETGVGGTG